MKDPLKIENAARVAAVEGDALRRVFSAFHLATPGHVYSFDECMAEPCPSARRLLPASSPAPAEQCGYCVWPDHYSAAVELPHNAGRYHRSTGGGYYRCTTPASPLQPAGEQQFDLDPLEFWCDLAEVLGHPRPTKVNPASLVAEVNERLAVSPPATPSDAAMEVVAFLFDEYPDNSMDRDSATERVAAIITRHLPQLHPYERALTVDWDTHNARRHDLISKKRSPVGLTEEEANELHELQWLAGLKREIGSGPLPAAATTSPETPENED